MIIRLGKFEAVIFCSIIVSVAFFFAISYETQSTQVSTQASYIELPIIMYHHITENEANTGKYTVHISEFQKDLEYIQNNGYTAVTVSDLVSYVKKEAELPKKPIMITFDDGFESFYKLAYPILKEKEIKSIVSVIGKVTERYSENEDHNINYSNLTFDEINKLISDNLVEIQNHSYDMHVSASGKRKGISKLSGESSEDYKKNLTEDLLTLQKILKIKCGITPECVVYPYGAHSKETLSIIKKMGFKSTMLCEEKINRIVQGDNDSLYNLGRFNRPSGISTEDFFSKIINTSSVK